MAAKAGLGNRDQVERERTPILIDRVGKFLDEQKSSVLNRLAENANHLLSRRFARLDIDAIWPRDSRKWDLTLAAAIVPVEEEFAFDVGVAARKLLGPVTGKADQVTEIAIDFVRKQAGERITEINGTTRKAVIAAVREVIEESLDEGLDIGEASRRLTDRVGNLTVWDRARSDLIARTETMLAYNSAALKSYEAYDVTTVQALDGDKDAACADRNGKIYPVDEAYGIADHPNGTLDWAPLVNGKAVQMQRVATSAPGTSFQSVEQGMSFRMPEVVINVAPANVPAPIIPAPIVNVTVPQQDAPNVYIEAARPADVTVNVPEAPPPIIVNTPAKAAAIQDVRIVDDTSPPKLKRVIRGKPTKANPDGPIEGMVEGR